MQTRPLQKVQSKKENQFNSIKKLFTSLHFTSLHFTSIPHSIQPWLCINFCAFCALNLKLAAMTFGFLAASRAYMACVFAPVVVAVEGWKRKKKSVTSVSPTSQEWLSQSITRWQSVSEKIKSKEKLECILSTVLVLPSYAHALASPSVSSPIKCPCTCLSCLPLTYSGVDSYFLCIVMYWYWLEVVLQFHLHPLCWWGHASQDPSTLVQPLGNLPMPTLRDHSCTQGTPGGSEYFSGAIFCNVYIVTLPFFHSQKLLQVYHCHQ